MAVQLNDLTSLYEPFLFESGNGIVRLKEKQNKSNGLAGVDLRIDGPFIFLTPNFLEHTKDLYKRRKGEHISLKTNNDGTLLIDDIEGNHYLVYIELKSGFTKVSSKAIHQIPVSSIKIKSYLRNLASYVPGEYKELGLIISYPPQASDKLDAENNDMVFDAKQAYIDGQTHSQANAIDQSLRRNGVAIIQASDFPTLSQATFHPDIQFQEMPVFHKSVTANGETIDLTPLLKQV